MGFRKILAALDYSPLSQAVFQQALELAQLNEANLMLFHCLTTETITGPPPFIGELSLSPQIVNQAYQSQYLRLEQQIQQARTMLEVHANLAVQQGVPTEFEAKVIDPGEGICQAVHAWGADLVILGRRGRKGLTEVLLGSVSNYVLHHAPCAVLAIQANAVHAPAPSQSVEAQATS